MASEENTQTPARREEGTSIVLKSSAANPNTVQQKKMVKLVCTKNGLKYDYV